jgi:hypothetical protein
MATAHDAGFRIILTLNAGILYRSKVTATETALTNTCFCSMSG